MAKKKKHGGKREGAGRKVASPDGKAMVIAASVPDSLVERLDGLAEKRGWNRSQAIAEAIRRLLDDNKT
jgi:predicted DCC family thiol-disulfide oxidoreductase YuxK